MKHVRTALRFVSAALAGVVVGVAWAAVVLAGGAPDSVRSGAWTTDPTSGSAETGIYNRARVAIGGLFALSSDATTTVTSPSTTGVVLFRRVVESPEHFAIVDAERRKARCEPL